MLYGRAVLALAVLFVALFVPAGITGAAEKAPLPLQNPKAVKNLSMHPEQIWMRIESFVRGTAEDTGAVLGMAADTAGVGEAGDEFTLEVNISNVQNLDGVMFEVYFDPAAVQVVKNEKGYSVTENPEVYKPDPVFGNPFYRGDTECSTRLEGFAGGINVGSEPLWLGRIRFKLLKEARTEIYFSLHKLLTGPVPPDNHYEKIPHRAEGLHLVFDFTPPEVTYLDVPAEVLAGGVVRIEAAGVDSVGLDCFRFECSTDGVEWGLIGEGQPVRQGDEGSLWAAGADWDTAGLPLETCLVRVTMRDPGGHEAALTGRCSLVGGSVRGRVYLEGLAPDCDRSGVKVYLEGTDIQAFTDAGGNYRLEGVIAGGYSLVAALKGYLDQAAGLMITVENPHQEAGDLLLPAGDINGDNEIDIEDISIMRLDYGKAVQRSDLDRSGLVGIRDLILLARNYTRKGATKV